MPDMLLIKRLVIISISFLLLGCGASLQSQNSLIYRLKDRGPVALSSDNPYLAGNLLLSKEMEKSPELTGFIKHRGAPAAIEVGHEYFRPTILYLYYPENNEFYSLEQTTDSWLIQGPETTAPEKQLVITKLSGTLLKPPVFVESSTKTESPKIQTEKRDIISDKTDPFIEKLTKHDEPEETESISYNRKFESFKSPSFHLRPDENLHFQENYVESVLAESEKHPAEISPNGDLVHYVTFSGETLSMISRWYTLDRANAGRLSRINKLTNPNHLEVGDIIIIPGYLLKNKNRLTEPALRKLERFVEKNK